MTSGPPLNAEGFSFSKNYILPPSDEGRKLVLPPASPACRGGGFLRSKKTEGL